jgi:hypothetical protein
MIVRKEVEFNEDEITTIKKFKEIVQDLSGETEIPEYSIVCYFLDCSEDEINEGKHDLEVIEGY